MATAKQNTNEGVLVPPQRKRELLGLVLMVTSFLLALALVTYSPADAGLAQSLSFDTVVEVRPDHRANNALGLVGAGLARILVPHFLGYPTLLFTFLLFAWGYIFFRHRSPLYLPLFTVLTAVSAFATACLFGWIGLMAGADLTLWSGQLGRGTAAWMEHVFGATGSLVLLLLTLSVTILVAIERDIQKTLDDLGALFQATLEAVRGWLGDKRERVTAYRERQRERRRQRRQERRAQQDEQEESSPPAQPETSSQAAAGSTASASTTPPPARGSKADSPTSPTVNDLFRRERSTPPPPTEPPRQSRSEPKPNEATTPSPSSPPPEQKEEPALHVQERVQEEKADTVDHDDDQVDENLPFDFPTLDLLDPSTAGDAGIDRQELEKNKRLLLDKLETYNIEITEVNAVVGPTVTRYELTPAPGIKISRITSLENDLAMAMAASGIRTIAPIPGKSAVGVEVPNSKREMVRIRDVLGTAKFRDTQMELPVVLGKSIEGEVDIRDLSKMPHLLIAGATGSGKSVGLNAFITSLIYSCHPAELKFVMIDPKKIELQQYSNIADHYGAVPEDADDPIITDIQEALGVLQSCEKEMEQRYDLLSEASVRNLKSYNRKVQDGALPRDQGHRYLPYLVVVVDELADLMMTAGKEIEGPIARLAQMARAVGIHLVLATQRPSVDVITGLIKANFPARMAYQVASRVDSRTILDQGGAEDLVGNGDMLYQAGSELKRLQGPFVSIDEVERLTQFVADQEGPGPYELPPIDDSNGDLDSVLAVNDRDELFEQAAKVIVRRQQGSVSLLQRKLSVGYTRAARIVDQLEDAGIVGPFVGSKARDVLVDDEEALERLLEADAEDEED